MRLLFLSIFVSVACGQPGFISLDCGGREPYNDTNGIRWIPDDPYIQTGTNATVSEDIIETVYQRELRHLRKFPKFPRGRRNCYALQPVEEGEKYLVRASFLYGNYDRQHSIPIKFQLLFDANHWDTVNIDDESRIIVKEMITMATSTSISVCLGRNDAASTPFISSLELRPLETYMYDAVNDTTTLFLVERIDNGVEYSTRYPDDTFDRVWKGFVDPNLQIISTKRNVSPGDTSDLPPSQIMQTAMTTYNVSQNITWSTTFDKIDKLYISMCFAEIQELKHTDIREFYVQIGGNDIPFLLRPDYLNSTIIYQPLPYYPRKKNFSLYATDKSTVGPLLNGWEIYRHSDTLHNGTYAGDVEALMDIRKHFYLGAVFSSWSGDPCRPKDYSWSGLSCSYKDPSHARVTGVDLSAALLEGTIPSSFANLSALQSLNLDNNNLSGSIPYSLRNLHSLKELNLENNDLEGSVPEVLVARMRQGQLQLRISGNPHLKCMSNDCDNKSKGRIRLIVGLATPVFFVALIAIAMFVYKKRQPKRKEHQRRHKAGGCRSFSYEEVIEMTSNFEIRIGVGGYGPVFHGRHPDGRQVAVKILSDNSKQGKSAPEMPLDWERRLRIALNAAQGLEYLHTGCTPAIIHRDIKSANILLNDKMEAKIADFGLSKATPSDEATHVSTLVKGTIGYLDPQYNITNQLNESSDVYSFGVVILEIITGQSPVITQSSGDKMHIVSWVQQMLSNGNIEGVVKQTLVDNHTRDAVLKVTDVAMACTEPHSIRRPTISEVVEELREAIRLQIAAEEYPSNVNRNRDAQLLRSPSSLNASSVTTFDQSSSNQLSGQGSGI
eukprot:Gb_41623 [translate_table: standard]